ncbi:hypothetical protein K0U27_08355 [archaeon]|nr:hypothetical protein [archaeon]
MKTKLMMLVVVVGLSIFGMTSAFAELEILVSPIIPRYVDMDETTGILIVRDIHHNLVWESAKDPIVGLDFVEGTAYHITAKKLFTVPLVQPQEYELIEIKQVFKSHEPYSWKGLCVPGYISIHGTCTFAFRCSEYSYPGKPCEISMLSSEYLKPIHQSKVGFLPEETICLEKLHLLISHDNTPACVKESSVEKLVERGFILGKNNNDSPYD